jgi:hypothetical protein
MSDYRLSSPKQADEAIARFFSGGNSGRIEVIEEKAFNARPLHFGTLKLSVADNSPASFRAAVRNGSFTWSVPDQAAVLTDLLNLLDVSELKKDLQASATERLERLLDDMADISVRLGLRWPRFDALSVAEMPFKRPVTVVADTSGVLQGALTFVAQHLHPMARLKIPAVLHMEVINQADRYMKIRRTKSARRDSVLAEHLMSQAGQRVLMRLELREDTEVERNLLIGDPLRSAFREDRDADLKEMHLNVPVRSYVDRMILEAARQHQAYASPGHPVHLLTGDQGLARMALAEGIRPLFFKKSEAVQFFSAQLTGVNFSPFTGKVISTSVSAVIWELATAFGQARLVRDIDGALIEVTAIDKDLGWSAFHSHDDLLWLRASNLPNFSETVSTSVQSNNSLQEEDQTPVAVADVSTKSQAKARTEANRVNKSREGTTRLSEANGAGVPFYRLNPRGLVTLIDMLSMNSRADDEAVMDSVGLRHRTGLAEYRRFLLSGHMIEDEPALWIATGNLLSLGDAQRESDLQRMVKELSATPSYAAFISLLTGTTVAGHPIELPIPARVLPSYLALGEVTGVGMSIPSEGYYATLHQPDLPAFAATALRRYRELAPDGGWVASGEWLETLARQDGIHPVLARDSLQEAAAADLIRRWTEGSTTDTRHDDHTLRVLKVEGGRPKVDVAYLYRGDFLMPDKSSSSLKLEGPAA